MKNALLFVMLVMFGSFSMAQNHFQVKSGKTFSTFLFRDSDKNKDETLDYITNNFLGLSYDFNLGNLHVLRPEVSYREGGARSVWNNRRLFWKLNYLDVNFAYMIKVLDFEKIKVYQGVAPGIGFLMSGEQYIGNDYFDVKASGSLRNLDFGVNFMANGKMKVFENVFLTIEYRYGLGIRQIESNKAQTAQVSRNRFHAAIFGLAVPL
jgi:hypothetical protein